MITINGVQCQELVRGLSEQYDLSQGPSMKKGFLCPWGSRFAVAQGLLGLATTVTVGGVITLLEPSSYPELSTAYCFNIEIEPVGPPTQGTAQIQWTSAIVWAHYKSQPWDFQGIDNSQINPSSPFIYAKQNIKFSTQTITVPGRGVWFSGTTRLIGQDYGFPVGVAELEITLIRVPYLPAQQIMTSLNAPLNSAAFLNALPGYLFFRGGSNEQTQDTAGNKTQDLRLVFSFRAVAPWDCVYDPVTQTWLRAVQTSGGSTGFIGYSDLSQLIPVYYNG